MTFPRNSHRPQTLLTGSTGLIGRYLLADLSRSRLPVAVLVRSTRFQSASERIESVLAGLERRSGRSFVRPVILDGDLTKPHLGLSRNQRDWVARNCGRVLHSAASLSFKSAAEHPDGEPYRTNVEGTERLLEFCCETGIHEWHYVSTAYVCGLRSGVVLEDERSVGQSFANDYEHSKVQAETLLSGAAEIDSLTVYRPSIVIDAELGSALSDKTLYNTFSTYLMLAKQFGLPEPGEWLGLLGLTGNERKNVVKADWVARMIVQILRHPTLYDRTYHLTAQRGISTADIDHGFRNIVQASGVEPRSPEVEMAPESLAQLATPFIELFTHYLRDDPVFDQRNMEHAISVCGESPCPQATIEDIHDLSRDQMITRQSVAGETEEQQTFELPLHDLATSAPLGNDPTIGLFASGPGGGDWTLVIKHRRVTSVHIGGADRCDTRLYARTDTWAQIFDLETEFATAIEHGALLIESNQTKDEGHTKVIETLQDFLAQMNQSTGTDGRSEVIRVR